MQIQWHRQEFDGGMYRHIEWCPDVWDKGVYLAPVTKYTYAQRMMQYGQMCNNNNNNNSFPEDNLSF